LIIGKFDSNPYGWFGILYLGEMERVPFRPAFQQMIFYFLKMEQVAYHIMALPFK
jgi:hypothetical protein